MEMQNLRLFLDLKILQTALLDKIYANYGDGFERFKLFQLLEISFVQEILLEESLEKFSDRCSLKVPCVV